ncbi:unnamed protein product [Orchesella dallaii]|uniref:Uncharacterized protein n=1 Tax=Orchesella dallaii TaxID=48710 RepID=A0ABP1Q509_9HEXA
MYEWGRKHLEQAQHESDFSADDINKRRRRVAMVEYNFARKVDSDSESELQHGSTPRRVNKKAPKRKLYSVKFQVFQLLLLLPQPYGTVKPRPKHSSLMRRVKTSILPVSANHTYQIVTPFLVQRYF